MPTLNVNGTNYTVDPDPTTPLLWVLRDILGLTGTKYGCGVEICGACTVMVDGQPEKACHYEVKEAYGRQITTIEGLSADGLSHPFQKAWIEKQVPQCGYCQSGQLMSAVALLQDSPNPSDAEIDAAMSGNICRCGAYGRIRKAIKAAASGTER